jgi:hypothetical protein
MTEISQQTYQIWVQPSAPYSIVGVAKVGRDKFLAPEENINFSCMFSQANCFSVEYQQSTP